MLFVTTEYKLVLQVRSDSVKQEIRLVSCSRRDKVGTLWNLSTQCFVQSEPIKVLENCCILRSCKRLIPLSMYSRHQKAEWKEQQTKDRPPYSLQWLWLGVCRNHLPCTGLHACGLSTPLHPLLCALTCINSTSISPKKKMSHEKIGDRKFESSKMSRCEGKQLVCYRPNNRNGWTSDEESLLELPPNVLVEILARLSIKNLSVSKSVCKTFANLSSPDPYFNSLYHSKTSPCLLMQFYGTNNMRFLYLFDSERDTTRGLDGKLALMPICQVPKFPVDGLGGHYVLHAKWDGTTFTPMNSCDGMLLFAGTPCSGRSFVCNPVTNEYLTLPRFSEKRSRYPIATSRLWFGFSRAENKHKVVRIFRSAHAETGGFSVQMLDIGSCSWRDIEVEPRYVYKALNNHHTFLNNIVYWLDSNPKSVTVLLYFDFEKENFGSIMKPDEMKFLRVRSDIGVVGGNLYVTIISESFEIWIMKKCGDWSKQYTIGSSFLKGTSISSIKVLQALANGEILMLWCNHYLACYCPKRNRFRSFGWLGTESLASTVLFTPSFVPLSNALMVDNASVQTMWSSASAVMEDLRLVKRSVVEVEED